MNKSLKKNLVCRKYTNFAQSPNC